MSNCLQLNQMQLTMFADQASCKVPADVLPTGSNLEPLKALKDDEVI